jgi:hypothetical protein
VCKCRFHQLHLSPWLSVRLRVRDGTMLRDLGAQLGEADFHGLTTLALAYCCGLWQVLRLVRRPLWFQARLDEIIRNAGATNFRGGRDFFGFREQAVSDRDVSVDLISRVFRVLAADRFSRCP